MTSWRECLICGFQWDDDREKCPKWDQLHEKLIAEQKKLWADQGREVMNNFDPEFVCGFQYWMDHGTTETMVRGDDFQSLLSLYRKALQRIAHLEESLANQNSKEERLLAAAERLAEKI